MCMIGVVSPFTLLSVFVSTYMCIVCQIDLHPIFLIVKWMPLCKWNSSFSVEEDQMHTCMLEDRQYYLIGYILSSKKRYRYFFVSTVPTNRNLLQGDKITPVIITIDGLTYIRQSPSCDNITSRQNFQMGR